MEEKAAEVQFEARRNALALIRKLRASLTKREHDDARTFFGDKGRWFSENWIFLPDEFVEGWKSIALKLQDLSLIEQGEKETQDEKKKDKYIKEAVELGALFPKLALEAENALRKKMGLKETE